MGKLFKVPGGEYLVDSEDYEIRKDEFGRPILCPLNQGGGGDQPKLYAPEIKITGDILTIIPNTDNGAFVTGYNGYMSVDGGDFELYGTLPSDQLELDLTAVGLPEGDFQFKATAIGTNFQESDASNVEDYTNIFYTVTNTLTNCTSNNSATSVRKGAAYSATLTAEAGYTMNGATVTVTMGGVDITSTAYADGVITIAQLAGDLVVTAAAAQIQYFGPKWKPSNVNNIGKIFTENNGKFYMVSPGGTVYESNDGATWNSSYKITHTSGNEVKAIEFLGTTKIGICDNGEVRYQLDGGSGWTPKNPVNVPNGPVVSVAKGNGIVVVSYVSKNLNSKPGFATTTNGVDWSSKSPSTMLGGAPLGFVNGKFFCVTKSSQTNNYAIFASDDGIEWEVVWDSGVTANEFVSTDIFPAAFAYGNGVYNFLKEFTSTDGVNWTTSATTYTAFAKSVAYKDGSFYANTSDTRYYRSPDGINWVQGTPNERVEFFYYSPTKDIFVGYSDYPKNKIFYATEVG